MSNNEELGYIYRVKNPTTNEITEVAWKSELYPGTPVAFTTLFGLDIGYIVGMVKNKNEEDRTKIQGAPLFNEHSEKEEKKVPIDKAIPFLDHLASPSEVKIREDNLKKEKVAFKICKEKIAMHKLNMKLISAHFMPFEAKLIFFFTSDSRVDFRALVKDLVVVFKMRIELRQIGPRDESRMLGLFSPCGRECCCSLFGTTGENIPLRMAKDQDLSLNSPKNTGPCEKLICCIAYEEEFYRTEKEASPPVGAKIKWDGEIWEISEINILTRLAKCTSEDKRVVTIPFNDISLDGNSGYWEAKKSFEEELFPEDE